MSNTYEEYIEMGLDSPEPLKLILCGEVQSTVDTKRGVVSVVYATDDRERAAEKLHDLKNRNPEKYYLVYGVPHE